MTYGICTIDECDRSAIGQGWCRKHYMRWWRWGDPLATRRIVGNESARFWSYVDKGGEHWLWTGAKSDGYGLFRRANGTTQQAHRFAYEELVGPIPDGLQLDHLCRVRACVWPVHTEPVTNRVNALRGESFSAINFAAVACIHGHPFEAENTYVKPDGGRQCKACRRATDKRRRPAKASSPPQQPA